MLPVAKLRKTACHGRVEIKEDIAEGRRVFMKILKEFKEFISKGNVLDMASRAYFFGGLFSTL